MSALRSDPETLAVTVDVSGLPAVMALARAARDVIDHAFRRSYPDGETTPVVLAADLDALAAAVDPIYPGPVT
jgi:hypothetical protein